MEEFERGARKNVERKPAQLSDPITAPCERCHHLPCHGTVKVSDSFRSACSLAVSDRQECSLLSGTDWAGEWIDGRGGKRDITDASPDCVCWLEQSLMPIHHLKPSHRNTKKNSWLEALCCYHSNIKSGANKLSQFFHPMVRTAHECQFVDSFSMVSNSSTLSSPPPLSGMPFD